MAEPVISSEEYKKSTVTPVLTDCVCNNVYNTSQTRVDGYNRHPTHHRNHSLSPCPNTRPRNTKRKQQKHIRSQQRSKVETSSVKGSDTKTCSAKGSDTKTCSAKGNGTKTCSAKGNDTKTWSAKGSGTKTCSTKRRDSETCYANGRDTESGGFSEKLDNHHQQVNSLNVSLKTSEQCKKCSKKNSMTHRNQPTASFPSVHNESKLSNSISSRRSSALSSAQSSTLLSIKSSQSSENIHPGKENLQSGGNTSADAEDDHGNSNHKSRAKNRDIPGRENVQSVRRNTSAGAEDENYDHRAKDRDLIKRKQKKPFRDKQLQLVVYHGPPANSSKENKKDRIVDYSKTQLRDLTNLPSSGTRRRVTLLTYPAKRSKGSGKGGNRRGQANRASTSRGAEGTQELPIQVTDTSRTSLQRPPRDCIVTSTLSVYGSLTASILPIPAVCTLEQEQVLTSRMRGERRTTSNQNPRNQDRPAVNPRHPNYSTQAARQESFRNWPTNTGQDPSRMAVYGFYFSGQLDLIRCFQCGIGLKDWSAGDEPLFEHIRHSAQCPFLRDLLGNDLLNAYRENLHMTGSRPGGNNTPNSGDRVRNPRFETLPSRLASFSTWPSTASQTPQTLADAGLFYTGFNDLCRCFHCDGGLQRWEAEDTPWVEHARWFPHCAYVKQIKGQAYINMVRRAAEEAQREEEDPPVYTNKVRERQVGSQTREHSANLALYNKGLNAEGMGAVELGFSRTAVQQAIDEYNRREDRRGVPYNTEDLVNILTNRIDNGETLPMDPSDNEGATAGANLDPEEENRRLKGIVKCMICEINDTNMLFLPCTHHRLCETCAQTVTHCPVCNRWIEDKIKTYMS